MTPKKIKVYFQIFILALLPAFILRPVVVTINNGDWKACDHSGIKTLCESSTSVSASQVSFHHIVREAPDVVTLIPRISKVKAPSLLENRFQAVLASNSFSPKSFLVLRI